MAEEWCACRPLHAVDVYDDAALSAALQEMRAARHHRQALVDTLEAILAEREAFHAAWHAIPETTGDVTLRIYGGEVTLATWREDDGE